MPKLLHIECLIADHHLHDVMLFLEERRAYNLQVSAYRDMDANGTRKPRSKGAQATEWLVSHIKGETTAIDLRDGFVKAGFSHNGLYAALNRAMAQKVIKKVRAGVYKPVEQK